MVRAVQACGRKERLKATVRCAETNWRQQARFKFYKRWKLQGGEAKAPPPAALEWRTLQ